MYKTIMQRHFRPVSLLRTRFEIMLLRNKFIINDDVKINPETNTNLQIQTT